MKIKAVFCFLFLKTAALSEIEFLKERIDIPEKNLVEANSHLAFIETEAEDSWKHYYPILSGLINANDFKVGCEIGVSTGGHSDYILSNTNIVKLYSIDPFTRNKTLDLYSPDYYYEVMFNRVLFRLSRYGNRSQLVRDFSSNVESMFRDQDLDFVFIDGSHEYLDVKTDLELYFNKVKRGGIIAGDDYNTGFPGVAQAVNEFFDAKRLKLNIDKKYGRIWWVIKE